MTMASFKNGWMSRVGIVVLAAAMVELISIVQYERVRKIMQEEMRYRGRVTLARLSDEISHALELAETTMREKLYYVKKSMAHPDSVNAAMIHLIDGNSHVEGGCLAFIPYYYPSKGRLFEPYATKNKDGTYEVQQIAGPDHDYTQNGEYIWVMDHDEPSWTDPYKYGPDSVSFTTYSYPIKDASGKIIAICGLDVNLSWLGNTLNAHQPYPSSFCIVLTPAGDLVAGPSEDQISAQVVQEVVSFANGDIAQSDLPGLSMLKTALHKEPYWQLVQVFNNDEAFARIQKQRRQQVIYVILCMAILGFVINRYTKNERNLLKATEEQARISGELAVASNIQKEMLPKEFPSYVYGTLEPAREVGGDIFDFYARDGKLFFCIGDVSGKGVPAALLMSMTHSLFHIVTRKVDSPAHILYALNSELCRGNEANMFMTYFVGCLDLYSGELSYASAGHDRPFILTKGISMLEAKSNLPLGVFPDTSFVEQSCVLEPGTTILLYTDGLTEAKNVARQEFGRSGIKATLEHFLSGSDQTLGSLVTSLSDAAHAFAGEAPQSDDLTLLAVRFDPENQIRDSILLKNQKSEVTRLSSFVKEFFAKLNIDHRLASGIRLALEEAVVNVIDYAYPYEEEGTVSIQADSNGKEVRFTITDSGVPFDPTAMLEPDTTLDAQNRPIGGLGILLSRRLMDSIYYSRKNGKNVLSLTKTIL